MTLEPPSEVLALTGRGSQMRGNPAVLLGWGARGLDSSSLSGCHQPPESEEPLCPSPNREVISVTYRAASGMDMGQVTGQ